MTNQLKPLLSLTLLCFFFLGCSKEESGGETKEPEVPVAAIPVSTMEVVTLEVSSTLNSEEYQGTLGDEMVNLVRLDNSHVMFMVPESIPEGLSTLRVNGLEIKARYDVSPIELEEDSEEVFNRFLVNAKLQIQIFGESPRAAYASNILTELEKIFNNATETEKREMALTYHVNNQSIDDILVGDYGGVNSTASVTRSSNKQSTSTSLSNLEKFVMAVATLGASSGMANLTKKKPKVRLFFLSVAAIAAVKAYQYHEYFSFTELVKLNFFSNNLPSVLKQQEKRLEFTHDKPRDLNLEIEQRTINSGDAGGPNANLKSFFTAHLAFKLIIEQINVAIRKIKDKLFITSSIGEFEIVKLEESEPTVVPVNSPIYEKMKFSIGSNKAEISEITYSGGVNMIFRIKDVENFNDEYLDTTLNYSFSDDFNAFSGSFPIRIRKEEMSIEGDWILTLACNNCETTAVTITLNSDGTATLPGANENFLENNYIFDGENLKIRYKHSYLTCNDELTVIETTEMDFELTSDNNFEGSFKSWDTGGSTKDCNHYSSQSNYSATLTR